MNTQSASSMILAPKSVRLLPGIQSFTITLLVAVVLVLLPALTAQARVETKVDEKFAVTEIHRFESLAGQLQTRLEEEKLAGSNPAFVLAMGDALSDLKKQTVNSEASLKALKEVDVKANNQILLARETLRESILALQESGQNAISTFIDADNGTRPQGVAKF